MFQSSKDRQRLLNYLARKNENVIAVTAEVESHSQQLKCDQPLYVPKMDRIEKFSSIDEDSKTITNNVIHARRIKAKSTKNKRKPDDCDDNNGNYAENLDGKMAKSQKKKKDQQEQMLRKDVESFLARHQNINEFSNKQKDSKKFDIEEDFEFSSKDTNFLQKSHMNEYSSKKKKSSKNQKLENDDDPFEHRSRQLAHKAQKTLSSFMFRYLNEYLYTHSSYDVRKSFSKTKFLQYHQAYERIVELWPLKPIDFIIEQLKKRIKPQNLNKTIIADIGCGSQPKIAKAFPKAIVYSYDLYSPPSATNIIVADMCQLPLDSEHCDYAIYSLSLMPKNLRDVFCEANRILKISSYVIIVEVASRFADYKKIIIDNKTDSDQHKDEKEKKRRGFENFSKDLRQYGFRMVEKQILPPNDYFVYFLLKKISSIELSNNSFSSTYKLPSLELKPCVYRLRQ